MIRRRQSAGSVSTSACSSSTMARRRAMSRPCAARTPWTELGGAQRDQELARAAGPRPGRRGSARAAAHARLRGPIMERDATRRDRGRQKNRQTSDLRGLGVVRYKARASCLEFPDPRLRRPELRHHPRERAPGDAAQGGDRGRPRAEDRAAAWSPTTASAAAAGAQHVRAGRWPPARTGDVEPRDVQRARLLPGGDRGEGGRSILERHAGEGTPVAERVEGY